MSGRFDDKVIVESGEPWSPDTFVGPLKVGRTPSLRDNAAAASFLAPDDSAYMSGVTVPSWDGGSFAVTSIRFPGKWDLEEMVSGELGAG